MQKWEATNMAHSEQASKYEEMVMPAQPSIVTSHSQTAMKLLTKRLISIFQEQKTHILEQLAYWNQVVSRADQSSNTLISCPRISLHQKANSLIYPMLGQALTWLQQNYSFYYNELWVNELEGYYRDSGQDASYYEDWILAMEPTSSYGFCFWEEADQLVTESLGSSKADADSELRSLLDQAQFPIITSKDFYGAWVA
jgi:hypothetical protein